MKPILQCSPGKDPYIRKVVSFVRKLPHKPEVYIVGGYLRDVLLGRKRERVDIDLAVKKGAIPLARKFAHELKSGFVVLDKKRGCARVVLKSGGALCTFDFTDFRGKDLREDLLRRDFTINALAYDFLSLGAYPDDSQGALIDLYSGVADLRAGKIRAVSGSSLREDPLRIIRAFSFKAVLNFEIDAPTLVEGLRRKGGLKDVSFERIRDEFFKILESPNAYTVVRELDEHGILPIFLPEVKLMYNVEQGPYHHLDVWRHSLETLKQMDKLVKNMARNRRLNRYLNEEISFSRKRLALLKFACILHDIGKPEAKVYKDERMVFYGHERAALKLVRRITERMKLSLDEYRALKKMVFWHLRPGYLVDNAVLTERARFRYFRDAGDEGAGILLLSIADQRSTRGPLSLEKDNKRHERIHRRLLGEFFARKDAKRTPRLINGHDLIRRLKLTPSPLFRKILDEVEEAQAAGEIKNKTEALKLAQAIAG